MWHLLFSSEIKEKAIIDLGARNRLKMRPFIKVQIVGHEDDRKNIGLTDEASGSNPEWIKDNHFVFRELLPSHLTLIMHLYEHLFKAYDILKVKPLLSMKLAFFLFWPHCGQSFSTLTGSWFLRLLCCSSGSRMDPRWESRGCWDVPAFHWEMFCKVRRVHWPRPRISSSIAYVLLRTIAESPYVPTDIHQPPVVCSYGH